MVLSSYGPDVINTSPHHQGSAAAGSRKIRSSPNSLVEGVDSNYRFPDAPVMPARAGITRALDADPANPLGDAFLEVPRGTESSQTHRWREMDSNHRYRIRNNPFWLAPVRSRNSPSATKTGSFVPGTDGSNPSPSSSESDANRFSGAHPLIAIRELAVARKPEVRIHLPQAESRTNFGT